MLGSFYALWRIVLDIRVQMGRCYVKKDMPESSSRTQPLLVASYGTYHVLFLRCGVPNLVGIPIDMLLL